MILRARAPSARRAVPIRANGRPGELGAGSAPPVRGRLTGAPPARAVGPWLENAPFTCGPLLRIALPATFVVRPGALELRLTPCTTGPVPVVVPAVVPTVVPVVVPAVVPAVVPVVVRVVPVVVPVLVRVVVPVVTWPLVTGRWLVVGGF